MMEPLSAHELRFREALPVIDAVCREIARRYHLSRDEQDEFASAVRLRLIADDYAVLRRFEGRSRLSTYLRTVITRQFLDERVKAWGRWRPSADAVRLGPTAVALERLIERQRLPTEEAIQTLVARDPSLQEATLRQLAGLLPRRVTGRRVVELEELTQVPSAEPTPDEAFEAAEAGVLRTVTHEALHQVLGGLPPRERLLLRLRFEQGTTVANIARMLGEEQKPLYRQLERLLAQLRQALEGRGVSAEQVRTLTQWPMAEGGAGGNPTELAVPSLGRPGMGPVAG